MLDRKHYIIINRRFINRRLICKIVNKFTIECLGGEKTMSEESKLVFVDTDKIPKVLKGKTGRNWKELVETIPKGKSAIIPEDFGTGATVRQAIKKINDELGKVAYKVTQRTEGEKTTVYVIRV